MTDNLTPPPELVQQWGSAFRKIKSSNQSYVEYMLDQAARWGADAELAACCEWLDVFTSAAEARDLRAARRPVQPSLKEQALAVLDDASDQLDAAHENLIRRALEQLS